MFCKDVSIVLGTHAQVIIDWKFSTGCNLNSGKLFDRLGLAHADRGNRESILVQPALEEGI